MDMNALVSLSYGLYVISSSNGEKINGQIANSAIQVTSEPPALAAAINNDNLTYEYIKKSGLFTISILSEEADMKYIGPFGFKSGRDVNKFANAKYALTSRGIPYTLENTVAWLECEVYESLNAGTHTLFVARLTDAGIINHAAVPMTYDYYHKVVKGKAPKSAPTFISA